MRNDTPTKMYNQFETADTKIIIALNGGRKGKLCEVVLIYGGKDGGGGMCSECGCGRPGKPECDDTLCILSRLIRCPVLLLR